MSEQITAEAGRTVVQEHHCTVFNSRIELMSVGEPDVPFVDVEAWLRGLEQRFSRFVEGNELASLNGSDGRWVEIGADLRRLLEHSLRVFISSRGLVNIAASAAVRRAGYRQSWPAPWTPDEDASDPAPIRPLTEVLEVAPGRARLQPGELVDFGAVAKGLWADEAVQQLGADAAASLGGDISARGPGPAGQGWPLGIPSGRTLLVQNGGVATTGTTRRRSGSAHHVIDPRSGLPSTVMVDTVTVLARSGTDAEWLATALVLEPAAPWLLERPELVDVFPCPPSSFEKR